MLVVAHGVMLIIYIMVLCTARPWGLYTNVSLISVFGVCKSQEDELVLTLSLQFRMPVCLVLTKSRKPPD